LLVECLGVTGVEMRGNRSLCIENIEHRTSEHLNAVILAGGLGIRLRAVVQDRPKVMANIAGWPFLAYLLTQIISAIIYHGLQLKFSHKTTLLGKKMLIQQ